MSCLLDLVRLSDLLWFVVRSSFVRVVVRGWPRAFAANDGQTKFPHSPFATLNDGDHGLPSDDGLVASITVFKTKQTSAGICSSWYQAKGLILFDCFKGDKKVKAAIPT